MEKPGWFQRVVDVLEWLDLLRDALRLGRVVPKSAWAGVVAVYAYVAG